MKALCLLLLSGVATALYAQDDKTTNLNREMTLEREYDPSVQDANKVNTLPAVKEPEVRKIPIDYSTLTFQATPVKEFSLLSSGNILTDMEYNKRRGYLNFGIGTYMNINGDLGYHILRTEKDQLNLYFSHRSTNGDVKYIQTDEEIKAKINDNLGGLNFRHVFDKAIFHLDGKYGYSAYNYYGLPIYPSLLSSLMPPADRETDQVAQTIAVYGGIQSKEEALVGYRLDLGYTNFGYKYGLNKSTDGPTEHTIDLKGGLSAATSWGHRIGLDASLLFLSYSEPAEQSRPDSSANYATYFDNHGVIMLSPYYSIDGGNWHLRLGANVGYITGDNDKFMASPNISIDAEVADRTVLYAAALGSINTNSQYELSQVNRYNNPIAGIQPSRNWLNVKAGVKSGVAPGCWFDVFGGYKIINDDFFFLPNRIYGDNDFANISTRMTDIDTKLLFFGAELKYAYQKFLDFRLKGVYNNWKANRGDSWRVPSSPNEEVTPYGRPDLEMTAGFTVKPMPNMAVSADYYLATGRYTKIDDSKVDYKFNNINELNVTGSYTINDTFGAYVKLNNLLFQKYEWYYGYPMQGFSVMAGVNLNF